MGLELRKALLAEGVLYFATHNACFFAQIFEGKIRMYIIHGYY